ncbi:hypothetical protein R83H12_02326 [Fibrobacteria bacterium R8-3-H12]
MKTKNQAALKSQSKDTKKANEIASKEIIVCFNTMLKNILRAWNLVVKQDVNGIKDLYKKTEEAYTKISNNYDENITRVFKLLPNCVKISFHIVQGLSFNLVNRPERAFQEYEKADERYNTVLALFQQIEKIMDKEFFSVFKFLLEFSNSIISILKEDSNKTLQYKGKYINQVERFRHLAGRFRKVSSDIIRFDNEDKEFKDLINDMCTVVMRAADICDDKAENIENDNSEITFLPPRGNKVFIVHGHDIDILNELKKILEKLNVEYVVLNEELDKGNTVIEKFENNAKLSSFAFVIITPDDLVVKESIKDKVKDKGTYYQGRPNVLFELGWFYGRFGRNKVKILKQENVEIPSDINGIITLNFNKKLKEISGNIIKELEHSGVIEKNVL